MQKTKFATSANSTFRTLSREQLSKVLGGDQCCYCHYADGEVYNECDDGDDTSGCCGPASTGMTCIACGT